MNKVQLIIFIVIGVIVALALLLLSGVLPGIKPKTAAPFVIEMWSPDDPPELWQEIISQYREKFEGATINYVKKDPGTYAAELVNALASGRGPDIFVLKDAELARHMDKIRPLSDGLLGYRKKDLRGVLADALVRATTGSQDELWGVPLYFDTLALLYNRDHFNSANIPAPPKTWDELQDRAKTLTKRSEVGGLKRSGAALGAASNVEHSSDILLDFIYQSRGEFLDRETGRAAIIGPQAQSALAFYASFADPTRKIYSWNSFFENSLSAFAQGNASMAFGYASDIKKISASNPQLNFDAAPMPQLEAGDVQINLGRFSVLTVSRLSKESENAWRFLLWLEEKDIQKKYIDALGLPPSRRDLAAAKPPRDYLATFYDEVLSARTIPIPAGGFFDRVLDAMIENVSSRRFSVESAVARAASDINAALERKQ